MDFCMNFMFMTSLVKLSQFIKRMLKCWQIKCSHNCFTLQTLRINSFLRTMWVYKFYKKDVFNNRDIRFKDKHFVRLSRKNSFLQTNFTIRPLQVVIGSSQVATRYILLSCVILLPTVLLQCYRLWSARHLCGCSLWHSSLKCCLKC